MPTKLIKTVGGTGVDSKGERPRREGLFLFYPHYSDAFESGILHKHFGRKSVEGEVKTGYNNDSMHSMYPLVFLL